MKKRILAVLLCIMMLPVTSLAYFNDVDTSCDAYDAINRLVDYKVLAGDGYGNFLPENNITRAEFAKIATVIDGLDITNDSAGIFNDMAEGYWANGYINCSAKNKLIIGYPDGKFYPESNINYAEVLTVVLRILGYGTKELGNNYPDAYIAKAKELGITNDLYFGAYDEATRKNVALIIDKALVTDLNATGTKKTKLITKMDYSVSEECIILATQEENKELLSDEVSTSIGTYKTTIDDIEEYQGQTAKIVTDVDNNIVGVIPIYRDKKRIAIESVADYEISFRDAGAMDTYTFDSSALVYYKSAKTTYEDVKDNLSYGMIFDVYTKNGKYDYAILTKYDLQGPRVVYSDSDKNTFGEPQRVVRDGNESSMSALQNNDVIYFDKTTQTLYAYCDKVSGVIEDMLPSKANLNSVVIAGKTYQLETQSAVSAMAQYDKNDFIVCLLGKDGKIAAVAKETENNNQNYGVLLSTEEKTVDSTKKYYATCLTSTGITQTFESAKSYSDFRGKIVNYTFEDGMFVPKTIGTGNYTGGTVNISTRKIGEYYLAQDCKIIDVLYAPSKNEDHSAQAKVIELSEITKNGLGSSDILYMLTDKSGKILFIALNNVTKDGYSFGLVSDLTKLSSSASYTLDVNGTETTYSANFIASVSKGQPIMANVQDGILLKLAPLVEFPVTGRLKYLDKNTVTVGEKSYSMAKNAVCYVKIKSKFSLVSIDDVKFDKVSSVQLFSDTGTTNGGAVRVIKMTYVD